MDKAALVNFDIETGEEVLRALDQADLTIKVALWLFSPDHEDWRLVIASRKLDEAGPLGGYRLVRLALDAAGFPLEKEPTVWIRRMNEPFIRDVRRMFSKREYPYGARLGGYTLGDKFIEGGFVYRVS